MDWASGSKIERRSFILPVQRSCREDRLPGASASPASPSKTQQALQLNTRNQPPSCACLCRPVESSILLPSVARGKENASHREVNEDGSPSRYSKRNIEATSGWSITPCIRQISLCRIEA